jgi:alpha-tubulin suppressor-like RCC1 family protein
VRPSFLGRVFTMNLRQLSIWVSCAALWAAAPRLAWATDATSALVRHAPVLEGRVEGSVQMMTGESVTLECGAALTGDLLVPGRPTVRVNPGASLGGTREGTGATSPSGYSITLIRGSLLGHVVRRTNPVTLPVVSEPPQPKGRRNVTINRPRESVGDYGTIRNLTLNRNSGQQVVPPGTYGDFTANSGSGLVLGVAGSTRAAIYNFQNLTIEEGALLQVSGPVIVTVARGFDADGVVGSASAPTWLTVNLSSGNLALINGAAFFGHVCAPRGTVAVGRNGLLIGGAVCDRLVVDRGGLLRVLVANLPPAVALISPATGESIVAFNKLALAATACDIDGTVVEVEFFDGATKLGVGAPDASRPGTFSLILPGGLAAGVHTLTAVATDNSGAATESSPVPVIVTLATNVPPNVTLTAPTIASTPASGVAIDLSATATDPDGAVAKVEFFDGDAKLGEVGAPTLPPPTFRFTLVAGLSPGIHSLTARATDNGGASASSAPVSVTVLASLPYLADFEAAGGYVLGSLDGQLGWRVSQGSATVTGDAFFSGSRSVALLTGVSSATISQAFAPVAAPGAIFADFYTRPVADSDLSAATTFDVEGSRFALVRNGQNGNLCAFDCDGAGGGQWRTTAFTTQIAPDGQALNWMRLTARLDFGRHTWDLYANGQMVSAGLGLRDSAATTIAEFRVQGHATGTTLIDYLYAGPQNPLFPDVNDNGIDDAWETQHGLSLSSNNRDLSPSGNGVSVVQAYIAGLDPQDYYGGVVPTLRWEGPERQVRRSGAPLVVPLVATILASANGTPLSNAPITFSVTAPKAVLLGGSGDLTGTGQLVVRADTTGMACVWLKLEAGWSGPIAVRAQVSVGGAAAAALNSEILPTVDSPELTCGGDQSLWLDSAGCARTWGRNAQGQLGDGTVADRAQMRRMVSVQGPLVSAAFGATHGLAVTATGTVLAWGDNYFGQLGDGGATSRRTAAYVAGLSGVVQVAAGDDHSLALLADGSVWAWGGNQSGQLGDGSYGNRAAPVQISGLHNIVRIAAGARHSLALGSDGTAWAWGSNEFGQLGDATITNRPAPAAVVGVGNLVALATGRQHVLALSVDGSVWAWGDNHAGQLGLGSAIGQASPQRIASLPFATGLAAGSSHSVALSADGTPWTWGTNDAGQLGNGAAIASLLPVKLTLSGIRALAAGWDHAVVLTNDGALLAWGLNRYGQLGAAAAGAFVVNPAPVDPAVN